MFNSNDQTSYKMINISKKSESFRRACVFGSIYVGKEVYFLIKNKQIEKGDPLVLAEIAGINAAKNTSYLILLCHQINIDSIFFNIIMNNDTYSIDIYCIVYTTSKTGAEMEAMCGVSIALLTIYDLTKKYDPFIYINNIKLIFKDGGENGLVLGFIENIPNHLQKYFYDTNFFLNNISVILIILSDRVSFGFYEDITGQRMLDYFFLKKSNILNKIVIPDDKDLFFNILKKNVDIYLPNLILTSGGTGISHRDISSSVILSLCDKIIPGFGELIRSSCIIYSNYSWLSCCIAGLYKNTLIVCLPGSLASVFESLNIIQNILLHSINIIKK